MTRRRLAFIVLAICLILGGLGRVLWRDGAPATRPRLVAAAGDSTGFTKADGTHPLVFPGDFGPHPEYQTEWWYYTGNLETADGHHFGYQLTFFRRALVAPSQRLARPSTWAADQVYMAHFALADVPAKRYRALERFSRAAPGLAGVEATPYRAWLEDWSVEEVAPKTYRLQAAAEGLAVALTLTDRKGPVPQGDGGYSQKGEERGDASYYYSQTRLASEGTVHSGGETYRVEGLSWMDHEFSTSGLGPDQVGWDWFALQTDDGGELMVYALRGADGTVDRFSSGTWVAPDGTPHHLRSSDFAVSVDSTWRSPRSGATYPARWTLRAYGLDLTLKVEPYLADQELNLSYTYWEGAVRVIGEREGRRLTGHGYVELTGYAGSLQGPL